MNNSSWQIVVLLVLAGVIYTFSPQAGLIKSTSTEDADSAKVFEMTIKDRTLADPRQGDLKVKVGSKAILQITTDEDGRVDLRNGDRAVFNPVFSGAINSVSVPTDRAGSFKIEFHPGAKPSVDSDSVLIGSIVVEQ